MRVKCIFAFLTLAGAAALAGSDVPAQTHFRDAAGDKIQSDGLSGTYGDYPDAINCVIDHVDIGGFYFLRTVTPACTPPVARAIKLDFSDAISRTPDGSGSDDSHVNDSFGQPGELDICAANAVADVRVIANRLFASNALSRGTPVTVPFSLAADFSHTAFTLEFEQPLQVTLNDARDPKVRILTAPADAIAELYKMGPRNRRVSLGRFRMPFQAIVTKGP